MMGAQFDRSTFDPDFASPSEWATMYRNAGLQVVPAYRPGEPRENPDQWKRPIPKWRHFEEEPVPEATFDRWYGPGGEHANRWNMGTLTGRCSGNAFVLDLDTHSNPLAATWWEAVLAVHNNGLEPETWSQRTGGGGRQLLFKGPPGWRVPTNRTQIGVDIRGQGGFAMLPPSRHLYDREYHWDAGRAPWEGDLADAPDWLLESIERLIEDHGGASEGLSSSERTENPPAEFDAFGNRIDGREEKLRDWVWAAVLDLHRRSAGVLDEGIAREAYQGVLENWLRHAKTRLGGVSNAEGLEREGRGETALRIKWRTAMAQWHEKVAMEAAKRPLDSGGPKSALEAQTAPGLIRTFDFANLVLGDIPDIPDYIEPNLLGPGGFLLIGGPPKAQKSWFKQDILVSAATGVSFLSDAFKVPRPLRVFDLQAEMNEKILRKRAKGMIGLSDNQIDMLASNLIVSDRFRMILNDDGVKIAAAIIKGCFPADEPPDILSFDPMANLFDQENENDNAQVMRFLTMRIEAVRQLVNPMAGVILVHHATKKGPDEIRKDPFNCFRGGGALRGHYDSGIIIFKKSDEGEERELHFELRGGESPEPMTVKLENGRMVKAGSVFFSERKGWPDEMTQRTILGMIDAAWKRGDPWSNAPQTMRFGRYAPAIICRDFPSIKRKTAEELINSWLMPDGVLVVATFNSDAKIRGLKVVSKV